MEPRTDETIIRRFLPYKVHRNFPYRYMDLIVGYLIDIRKASPLDFQDRTNHDLPLLVEKTDPIPSYNLDFFFKLESTHE